MEYASSPPPPPQLPKDSFARRYKFLWPLLLTVNLSVGAYLFMRTKKKEIDVGEELVVPVTDNSAPVTTTAVTSLPVAKETLPSPPAMPSAKTLDLMATQPLDPITENHQRELFKWILEEKRKTKPNNVEEKKRIDEDKAILKRFIRAKSIPTI